METAEPRWFDIAVLLWLAVPVPLIDLWGYRRFERRLAAGDAGARLRLYRSTIAYEWLAAIALGALWLGLGRTLPELGLGAGAGGWRFWLGGGLAAAAALLLAMQTLSVRRSAERRRSVLRRVEHLAAGLPHDRRELGAFVALSLTAGVCEELIYRGYAIWLLAALGGVWLAVPASAVLFALGHLYQGPRTLPGILLVGLVTAGLYLLTGALWAPMLLHAAIDVTSGVMVHAALRDRGGPAAADAG